MDEREQLDADLREMSVAGAVIANHVDGRLVWTNREHASEEQRANAVTGETLEQIQAAERFAEREAEGRREDAHILIAMDLYRRLQRRLGFGYVGMRIDFAVPQTI